MDSDHKRVVMVKAHGNMNNLFKESERTFDSLRPRVEKEIRGRTLSYQIKTEIKKIADAINLAKSIARRLSNQFPQGDSTEEIQIDLEKGIVDGLNSVFENLDVWENKWKDYFESLKPTNSDWFGPFSEDQAEEILKLRYLGHSYDDIADMLGIKNTKMLEEMSNRWMLESSK